MSEMIKICDVTLIPGAYFASYCEYASKFIR